MTEIEKAAEWFENRAKTTPMQGASRMFELAEKALREKANGVTAQEWISVKDRLPEESGLYITFGCTAVPVRWLHNFDKDIGKFGAWWNYEPDGKEHTRCRFIEAGNISHWMPLPEEPKGE